MARKPKSKRSSARTASSDRRRNTASEASPFYADAINIAGSLLRNRQQSGASQIDALARTVHDLAAGMDNIPNLQTYVSATAEQMENLSDYVSATSLEDMIDDAASFARRYPLSTAAFAVAAGFGFIRLIAHNSADRRESTGGRAARGRKRSAKSASRSRANGKEPSHERANAT